MENIFHIETDVSQSGNNMFQLNILNNKGEEQTIVLPSKIIVKPSKVIKNNTFFISIELGEKRIDSSLHFEEYARKFLNSISTPDNEKINRFVSLLNNSSKNGYKHKILINNKKSNDIVKLIKESDEWNSFEANIYIPFVENKTDFPEHIYSIAEDIYGLILSLVDLEEIHEKESVDQLLKYPEGKKTKALVNKYERNRLNRKCCLDYYGYNCMVCNLNFADKYKKIGENFIHVHHIVPVSELGEDYSINPIKDLVPVCPNCHAMLHKRNPPYSINELKDIIRS